MKFIDLDAQHKLIKNDIDDAINKVLDHKHFIIGPEVHELEVCLANYVGVNHCITVSSGTDALLIAMMSLGIGQGDEVITTPFTFVSTSEMIVLLGAKPVYVDIDAATYNIDASKIEQAITSKTKLILPVSLYGQCSDMDQINQIALKYALPVIEDAAQSFGAKFNDSRSCGLSTFGCASFFPSKPLGCYGDGGALFTNDDKLAQIAREVRAHGQEKRYYHTRIGINGRLDTIQAAILLVKMKIFNQEVELRKKVGDRYTQLFKDYCPDDIITPFIDPRNVSVYAQYTIQVSNRNYLMNKLNEYKIPSSIHYPVPLNKQPAFATEEFNLDFSNIISDKVMSIPMHPYLLENDQQKIVKKCSEIINKKIK